MRCADFQLIVSTLAGGPSLRVLDFAAEDTIAARRQAEGRTRLTRRSRRSRNGENDASRQRAGNHRRQAIEDLLSERLSTGKEISDTNRACSKLSQKPKRLDSSWRKTATNRR